MDEIDLLPAQGAQLGRTQPMPESQQDHGRVTMPVPIAARRLDQPLNLPLGQVLADPVMAIGESTTPNCSF